MKRSSLFLVLLMSSATLNAQIVHENTFLFDVHEPFRFNHHLKRSNYSTVNRYDCPQEKFSKDICRLTQKEIYNDSGRLVTLIKGHDLLRNKIHYTIHYKLISDTVFEVTTKYSAAYVDSLSLFMRDTTIKGKLVKKQLYKREKNGDMIVRSLLYLMHYEDEVRKVLSYDVNGKLQEIYHPFGDQLLIKESMDTTYTDNTRTITLRKFYPEQQLHSYSIIDSADVVLEKGFWMISEYGKTLQKTIYTYNEYKKPLLKITVGNGNELLMREEYTYEDSVLVKYRRTRDIHTELPDELHIYDKKGKLIEAHQARYVFKYYYDGELIKEIVSFVDDKFERRTYYEYER